MSAEPKCPFHPATGDLFVASTFTSPTPLSRIAVANQKAGAATKVVDLVGADSRHRLEELLESARDGAVLGPIEVAITAKDGRRIPLEVASWIQGVDGPSDELAPSFSNDYLYFASDRPGGAGGLDLYRARFHEGEFEAPERLGDALQSAADDTDPAPSADDGLLVFASERGGDFDLYEAGAGAPQRIEGLATRDDEDVCLYAHYVSTPAAAASLLAAWRGDPFVASAHGADVYKPSPAALRLVLRRTRAVVTCTAAHRAHLESVARRSVVLVPQRS